MSPRPPAVASLTGTKRLGPARALAELAARQELVLSLEQLSALGVSARAVRGRVASGRLFRRHRGVFSLTPTVSRRGEFFAAVLACGPDSALSHQSAGHEHAIRRHHYGPVHVTVPRPGVKSRPGIVVHCSASLPTVTLDGLRVTTAQRTLTDLADVLTPTALQLVVSTAERLGLADRDTLVTPPGRRRVTRRAHLFTRSGNERAFHALLRAHRLPLPLANVALEPWEADFLWPEHGLVVEIDAWFTHGNRRSFESDRRKDEFLDELGLKLRRVTDRRLREDPTGVAATVERALGACRFVPERDVTAWTRRTR